MKITPVLKRTSVALRYSVNGKPYLLYLKISVDPERWSKTKKEIKGEGPVIASNNALITAYQGEIEKYILGLRISNKPYVHAKLQVHLYNIFESNFSKNKKEGLKDCFDVYLNAKKNDLQQVTITAYKNTKNHLENYLKSIRKEELPFEDVDMNFYESFKEYLKEECSAAPATRGKQFKNIKSVMKFAHLKGLHSTAHYVNFKKENEPSINVYLNEDEIVEMLNIKKLKNKEKDVINAFTFMCYTAMRYTDYINLKSHHFSKRDGTWYINFFQSKTSNEVNVPILYINAIKILEDCKFELPKFENNDFNKELKRILKEQKLFENKIPVKKEKINGPVIRRNHISSHTGRRSFCTNLYLKGIPVQQIMAASGHQSVAAFKLYIKATQLDKAAALAKHSDY